MGLPVNVTGAARPAITPQVLGVLAGDVRINGDLTTATDQPLLYLRVCIQAGDDVTAAANLQAGGPDVFIVQPGGDIDIEVDRAITMVHLIGVGSAAAPADYTGGSYVASINDTVANFLAQLARFEFLSSDAVKRVRISMSNTYASGLTARAYIQGVSYA